MWVRSSLGTQLNINLSKAIKLYENYQTLDNLLNVLYSDKYKIKISAIDIKFGFYLERVVITPNSNLFNKIINIIEVERDSIGDEIDKL